MLTSLVEVVGAHVDEAKVLEDVVVHLHQEFPFGVVAFVLRGSGMVLT